MGQLYGTTSGSGPGSCGSKGTIFKLTGRNLTTLWSFTGGSDGGFPSSGLTADKKGALYGTTSVGGSQACPGGCGTVYRIDPRDQTLTTIWSFSGSDGANPGGELLIDHDGAVYGTTTGGGSSGGGAFGSGPGVVFRLTPPKGGATAWTETTLWSFSGGADGASPFGAGVIADDSGALYGTTIAGGSAGGGVAFRLTPPKGRETAWTETTLWSFSGDNGGGPAAPLIMDRAGVLYGTAGAGAINGGGTVFKLTPPRHGETAWSLTTLWSFTGGSDGGNSVAGLIADKRGALYGTTSFGGDFTSSICSGFGCGVVFKLTGTGYVP